MSYDSTQDTLDHIDQVRGFLFQATEELRRRAREHDDSKLREPEKPVFDEVTPKLRELTYGSDEYRAALAEMGPALEHHYEHNRHHPEHFELGVEGMNLIDIIEMLADWKAATMRHADGDLDESIDINIDRFHVDGCLRRILHNTARDLGWL